MSQMVKNPPAMRRPGFDPWAGEDPLEKDMATTPIFLPGESHGQKSLVGYSPGGCKEVDTMEQLSWHTSHSGLFSTISSAFLTNLCLLSVIIPNRGLLKSSTMIVHVSIYPCNSVSFCFAYFDAVS